VNRELPIFLRFTAMSRPHEIVYPQSSLSGIISDIPGKIDTDIELRNSRVLESRICVRVRWVSARRGRAERESPVGFKSKEPVCAKAAGELIFRSKHDKSASHLLAVFQGGASPSEQPDCAVARAGRPIGASGLFWLPFWTSKKVKTFAKENWYFDVTAQVFEQQ
jgi:hypothetical protein